MKYNYAIIKAVVFIAEIALLDCVISIVVRSNN